MNGANAVSGFIQQLHTGKGAGGDFAAGVRTAFEILKTAAIVWWDWPKVAVDIVVTAFGAVDGGVCVAGCGQGDRKRVRECVQGCQEGCELMRSARSSARCLIFLVSLLDS